MRPVTKFLAPIFLGLIVAACSNPADNKPEAKISEPAPIVTPPAEATPEGLAPTTEPVTEIPAAGAPATTTTASSMAGGAVAYVIAPDSTINFVGSKVTGKHDGGFKQFSGEIHLVNNDPRASHVKLTIDTHSLWTDTERLTGHLKSADFFDVEKHPTATFDSTSITGPGPDYEVTGNLQLHGVTKGITFPAKIEVGATSITATAEFFINRKDFEIVYAGKPDDLIRDEVVINFVLKANKAQ